MRLIACLLFLFFIAPAYSQHKMNGKDFSENLEAKCRIGFDAGIIGEMENTGIAASKIDGRDNFSAGFTLKIREAGKKAEARINVYCSAKENSSKISKSSATPRDQIAQEDSGGRYYRQVAWQRNASGINWKGQIAYADALHGDGTVLAIDFYLLCLKVEGNVCLHIEVQPPRTATRKVRATIMKMISRMEHFE